MNHIAKLTQDRDAAVAEIHAMRAELRALKGYLTSSKFFEDPTVQVRDVLARLDAVESAGGRASDEVLSK